MDRLSRVLDDEINSGGPLPFTVYDETGHKLFDQGIVIGSVGYLRFLLSRGLYRRLCAQASDDKPITYTSEERQ